jgi:hypothetical protein
MVSAFHRDIMSWLRAIGATRVRLTQQSRHPRLHFTYAEQALKTTVPGSPHNQYRALRNMEQ